MKKAKISLYIMTVVALAAVVWLVFAFAPMAQVETPPVVLPTEVPEQDAAGGVKPPSKKNGCVCIRSFSLCAAIG